MRLVGNGQVLLCVFVVNKPVADPVGVLLSYV